MLHRTTKNKTTYLNNSKVLRLEQTDGDRTNKQRDLLEDRQVDRLIAGWLDGWMDEQMDGWTDDWIDGWVAVQMSEWTDGHMHPYIIIYPSLIHPFMIIKDRYR